MPRAVQATPTLQVEFVVSVPLDLVNAMHFTALAGQMEGVEGWPAETHQKLDPDLKTELTFLFTYPKGEPGVMGALNDAMFFHPEVWGDYEALLRFVRSLPPSAGNFPDAPSVQGLIERAIQFPWNSPEIDVGGAQTPRERVAAAAVAAGYDPAPMLDLFDRPEELRDRMVLVIERFYARHYRADLPRRLPCMERSAAAHRADAVADISAYIRALTNRTTACLDEEPETYTRHIFAPSVDVGPYVSCTDMLGLHGLYYACEPKFMGEPEDSRDETRRMAQIYKALADEHRLRILGLLRERDMYAQEIVDRTGLHQSVVSRHLTFMHATGLVRFRRQNNMKFYSLNPAISDDLKKTLELFSQQADVR